MTGFDIYTAAAATLYTDTGKNVADEKFTVQFLNRIMQETLSCENSIREASGEELLTAAPVIHTLDQAIPYHDDLTRTAFVYELASLYQQEELDAYQASYYHGMYLQAVHDAKKGVWEIL